jgi:radical S-adenosyl methionine domain-containing protein 2
MKNKILSVCWDITSKCNDSCEFCFRDNSRQDLDKNSALEVVDKLHELGVKKLTFAGGEPLLVPFLSELLSHTKRYAIKTSVTTNGLLLEEQWNNVVPMCDWITFSLDAPTADLQAFQGRDASHFDRILNLIKTLSIANTNVKLNTLITKRNIDSVIALSELVKTLPIKRWKVIRFYPVRGSAKINFEKFDVSEDEFNNVEYLIKKSFTNTDIKLEVANHTKLETEYFSLFSDGVVRFNRQNKEVLCGSLLSSSVDFGNIGQYFDINGHQLKHSDLSFCF